MKKLMLGVLILLLFVVVTPVAFAESETGLENSLHSGTPIPPEHFWIIAHYADIFFSQPAPVLPPTQFAVPTDLQGVPGTPTKNLSDYYIIDVRDNATYLANHVPGAVNVPFAMIAKPWNLKTYPTDKDILVICYTGHTASMTTAILDTMGFKAFAMKGGMSTWPCNGTTAITAKDAQGNTITVGHYYYTCVK